MLKRRNKLINKQKREKIERERIDFLRGKVNTDINKENFHENLHKRTRANYERQNKIRKIQERQEKSTCEAR